MEKKIHVLFIYFQTLDIVENDDIQTQISIFYEHRDEDFDDFMQRYDNIKMELEYPLWFFLCQYEWKQEIYLQITFWIHHFIKNPRNVSSDFFKTYLKINIHRGCVQYFLLIFKWTQESLVYLRLVILFSCYES